MSSFKNAYTTVKNFFTNIRGQEEATEEGHAHSGRLANRLLSGIGASNRKRSAPVSNTYEPEITDDEDDTPGFPYPTTQPFGSKRLRVDSPVELEMPSNKRPPLYPTRRSGIPPGVEGVEHQPWEFQFRSKSKGPQNSGSSNFETGGAAFSNKISKTNFGVQTFRSDVPGTSRASSNNPSTSRKNVEIITLDDDNDIPRASTSTTAQQTRTQGTSRTPGRNEAIVMKPRVSSPMKASKRDSNILSKCLGDMFGRKLVGTLHSTAIRLKEKQQYKQLLMSYNVLSSNGTYEHSALTKSKVSQQQLQVMYNKFGTSPTEGTVTLRMNGRSFASGGQEILSSADRCALVPHPRLFSTATEIEAFVPSPKRRAIEYSKEPDVIDLEKEPSTSKAIEPFVSPITPVTSRRSLISSTPTGSPRAGNFTNLEDALNSSGLSAAIDDANPEAEDEVLALEDSSKEDGDISIIAEKIVNKSRSKSTNTLALEQTLCPYVDERWLTESKSSWRDNQKHRERRIQEEAETMSLLKRESTLEKDLEEKIRKKLTLTEIIVLEEPPAVLPDLTSEMLKVINYAKARGNDSEVLAEVRLLKDNIKITRGDVKTLGPLQWLNDNIINTYLGLIVLRGQLDGNKKVYAFQTFFYPKLLKEGYSNSLKRWTRKDDLFAYELIILPIHLGLHWCLACIDNRNKTIKYYDSLGGTNDKCLNSLLDYISREMKERKQVDLDKNAWTLQNMKEIPQQQNGSDCGMFTCKFAEYLSRGADLTFKQEDMQYYRDRMIYELIKSELMSP